MPKKFLDVSVEPHIFFRHPSNIYRGIVWLSSLEDILISPLVGLRRRFCCLRRSRHHTRFNFQDLRYASAFDAHVDPSMLD